MVLSSKSENGLAKFEIPPLEASSGFVSDSNISKINKKISVDPTFRNMKKFGLKRGLSGEIRIRNFDQCLNGILRQNAIFLLMGQLLSSTPKNR